MNEDTVMLRSADALDVANEHSEQLLKNAIYKEKNEKFLKVEANAYCNFCSEELHLEGQKYCDSTCANKHHQRMKLKGIRV